MAKKKKKKFEFTVEDIVCGLRTIKGQKLACIERVIHGYTPLPLDVRGQMEKGLSKHSVGDIDVRYDGNSLEWSVSVVGWRPAFMSEWRNAEQEKMLAAKELEERELATLAALKKKYEGTKRIQKPKRKT